MSIALSLDGLEDLIERIVDAKLAALTHRDEWYTVEQAADYLGVSVGQVHNLVSARRLPRHGARGERLRFRRSELDAYQSGH
jgi:excisionase family DNA binding protein